MLGAGRQNGGMTARIRPASAAEAAALHELAALTFPLACPPSTTEASKAAFIAEHLSEAAFARYLADPARDVVVADDAGQLIGYAMVVHGEPADPDVAQAVRSRPTAELSKLYVHPLHHGGGVASALVAAVVDAAARHRAASVWLGLRDGRQQEVPRRRHLRGRLGARAHALTGAYGAALTAQRSLRSAHSSAPTARRSLIWRDLEHDLAARVALLEQPVGLGGLAQRQHVVEVHAKIARLEQAREHREGRPAR